MYVSSGTRDSLEGDGILPVLEREVCTLGGDEAGAGRGGEREGEGDEGGVLHVRNWI